MSGRYINYIPAILEEYREINSLAEIEDVFLEEMYEAKNEVFDNQWIATSRESGLTRLASIMALTEAYEDLEELRDLVLLYWNSNQDYTYFYLLDFLDACCGEGQYVIDMQYDVYFLKVVLDLSVQDKQDMLQKKLREWIPANLDCMVYLDTNTYAAVGVITHGSIKEAGITYGGLPFADLAVYVNYHN